MLLDLLFPAQCLGCGWLNHYICADCINLLHDLKEPICPMCAKPAPFDRTHAGCARPLGLNGLLSLFPHQGLAKRAVIKLKFARLTHLYSTITNMVQTYVDPDIISHQPWIIVPISLHPLRLKQRGFNQALLIAESISQAFSLPLAPNTLLRHKHTRHQRELNRQQRLENIRRAFTPGPEIDRIKNRPVLLVDDVYTTGATLKEAAKILKRSQAKLVWGFTLNRQVTPKSLI